MIDARVLEAAMRIRNMPEFQGFRDYLKARREQHRDKLETLADDERFFCAQGRALEVRDILDLIEDAPNILEKQRAQKK